MSEVEEWRPVVGFEGLYEASSLGRIRSLDRRVAVSRSRRRGGRPYSRAVRGRILALTQTRSAGYLMVNLNKDAVGTEHSVHVLICTAFHGPRPLGKIVAHGDGKRRNNAASNLRWATYQENAADAARHGTSLVGERNRSAKLSEAQARAIKFAPENVTVRSLALAHGVSVDCIRSIRTGSRWKHLR